MVDSLRTQLAEFGEKWRESIGELGPRLAGTLPALNEDPCVGKEWDMARTKTG